MQVFEIIRNPRPAGPWKSDPVYYTPLPSLMMEWMPFLSLSPLPGFLRLE